MINENKTFELFGYYSKDLLRGSNKKIWVVCETCGKEWTKAYSNYNSNKYKVCRSCIQKHVMQIVRGPFNIEYFQVVEKCIKESHINELRTFKDFGYYSIDLTHGSNRKVWAICQNCKSERILRMSYYVLYNDKCNKCIRSFIREPFNIEYFKSIQNSILNSNIKELQTFENFGYYSIDLTCMSDKNIYVICHKCNRIRIITYGQYIRKGNICKSCAHKGKFISKDARKKMSIKKLGTSRSLESRKRSSATHQGLLYNEWKSFITKSPYCVLFNDVCKESNRNKYNRQCFICGLPESKNITSTGKYKSYRFTMWI